MPAQPTYPGVYVEEISLGTHPVTSASTAQTVFADCFAKGPVGTPVEIFNWNDFSAQFGGLDESSEASFGIHQYFLNGGEIAWVVRLENSQGNGPPQLEDLFPTGDNGGLPAAVKTMPAGSFNLLCLPVVATYSADEMSSAIEKVMRLAQDNHAFFLADIPASVTSVDAMLKWMKTYVSATADFAAVYFPRLLMPNPLANGNDRNVGPSGTLAGIYAKTDDEVGVWKAPAGVNAVITNATLAEALTDVDSAMLNPQGINALRSFPTYGNVVWGARTMAGADQLASEWKYVNVRRLANFIENSLNLSLQWTAFEPNGPLLWRQITREVTAFMSSLWTDGALFGSTQGEAYFVQCDSTTNTATDIEDGIVNMSVGFAPLKPAEFIVLRIQARTLSPSST